MPNGDKTCLFYINVVPKVPLVIKNPPPNSRKSIKYIILQVMSPVSR
jgi:hypothetical protein